MQEENSIVKFSNATLGKIRSHQIMQYIKLILKVHSGDLINILAICRSTDKKHMRMQSIIVKKIATILRNDYHWNVRDITQKLGISVNQ